MVTETEIKKLTENIYEIIESELGREIVDNILIEKYGAQFINIKQEIFGKVKK